MTLELRAQEAISLVLTSKLASISFYEVSASSSMPLVLLLGRAPALSEASIDLLSLLSLAAEALLPIMFHAHQSINRSN